jgi:putative salt-induced outer membrane protein YdiY
MKMASLEIKFGCGIRIGLMALLLGLTSTFAIAFDNDGGWTPSLPVDMPTQFDWVQLSSGEWLGGELIALYDGTLEFDSEEMGMTKVDWDDVVELRTVQVLEVRPITGTSATGKVIVKDGMVTVLDDQKKVFEQSEILTVTAGVPKERNYWSGEMSGNLNLQSGNTESQGFNFRTFVQRRTVKQRVTGEYIGNYDETQSEETENNHRLSASWNRFISQRLFWTPIFAEYFKDKFQNIQHRVTLGPAIGYEIIDTAKTAWSASGGPAYTHTWFEQVQAGEDDNASSVALLAQTRIDHELTSDIDLWYDYRFLLASRDTGGYSHRMEFGASFDVVGDLDVRAAYVWGFISDPVKGNDGNTPEQSDTQLLLGVGYSF